jgi:glucose/arabinose dehydrogenase
MTDNHLKENPMNAALLQATRWLSGLLLLLMTSVAFARPAAYTLTTIADTLDTPWSLVQLPDTSFLVTLRGGELLRVSPDGARSKISGTPSTYVAGQGGFFDIALHPKFATNQMVYLSYASGTPAANGTAITRAVLAGDSLRDARQILLVKPLKDTPQHYGGKMLFLPDGTLLLSTGDGFEYREAAQDLGSELGKVLRINDDGSVPDDNPFIDGPGERIWSYGHRNPQGFALDRTSGTVYQHEHGPRGGDEINVIIPGKNYGWPAITYGVDYSGGHVSPFTKAEGMEQPLVSWVPSIAPSGMVWYNGEAFPQWRGNLLVGALVDQEVRRIDLKNIQVLLQEPLFSELGARIRDVRVGQDGHLYLLTDGADAKLIRVSPAAP